MANGCFTISVSGDDLATGGRTRFHQNRQKRKKHELKRNNFFKHIIIQIMRCWPLIFFVSATGLLILDSKRIISVYPRVDKSVMSFERRHIQGNLDRMDPTTKKVNGSIERCLKLLDLDELEHFDIPLPVRSKFSVPDVGYISVVKGDFIGVRNTTNGSRFNLFTGYQSMDQRRQSFIVNESPLVHCGFYSENGGFKISLEDRNFMQSCIIVVSTCAFGGGDNLFQPIGMSKRSLQKVCYVAFWDEITMKTQSLEGNFIDEKHMIGKWRVVLVDQLPFADQRLNGKIPKMLSHRLFPRARYSIWVDSKSQFRRDPLGVLEALLWRTRSSLAISEHGARSSVFEEAKAIVRKNKASPEQVELQMSQYHEDGFPDSRRLRGKKGLAEASVIVREHSGETNRLMCVWFNEVVRFTSRDQLSFPFVLYRLGLPKKVNLFPVCTRKDLVNSIGHVRKPKPLPILSL